MVLQGRGDSLKQDTILLFQEPERYFFPQMKGIVYAPFGVANKRLRFWLYLLVCRFPFLCFPVLFGPWKKQIRTAKQVILFDFGYVPGIEHYIHRINPSCRVCLYYWNIMKSSSKGYQKFAYKQNIYATDKNDCQKYGLLYQSIFYVPQDIQREKTFKEPEKLFFFGLDKGRGPFLLRLKKQLEAFGICCDITVFSESHCRKYKNAITDILADQMISYKEYCSRLSKCGILLDLNQDGQTALSMRVMEAIFFEKKLITFNKDIATYDFYDENNIFIMGSKQTDGKELLAFIKKPFRSYEKEVLYQYSYENWKKRF